MTRDVLCSVLCVTYLLFTANMNFPVTVIGNCFLKRFFMMPSSLVHIFTRILENQTCLCLWQSRLAGGVMFSTCTFVCCLSNQTCEL